MPLRNDNAEEDLRQVQIAVMAKAPIPGLAKTRLIPALGRRGAARLHRQLTRIAVRTALDARLGAVTLWCTPDVDHNFFKALRQTTGVDCRRQPDGDLGERMLEALRLHCRQGPTLLIGTDCPALGAAHLRAAARALVEGADAVFCPAEDGGYVLVGLRHPQPALFCGMTWSTPDVMAHTRARGRSQNLRIFECETLWDIDEPADLPRLRQLGVKTPIQRT